MKDDLLKLLNAQELDLNTDKLMKDKNEYPEQIKVLKKEIEDLKNNHSEKEARHIEIEKTRRDIEAEIDAERELLVQKEKRLLETKNNREYTAVHNEIELARERIDALETEDLELMTELDTLIPEKEELLKQVKSTEKDNTEQIIEIQKKFDSIESDIAQLDTKKKKEIADVKSSRGLNIYNRLRQGRSGIAISPIDKTKHTCTSCFKQLPPQKVMEVRRAAKIILCESCGSILVWDSRKED